MEEFSSRIDYIGGELENSNDQIAKSADQLKELVKNLLIIR